MTATVLLGTLRRCVNGALLVFVLSFALYLRTLAPTITWQHDGYDAGDLITAAYTLGIPHPTGYPTYMLLGKCFTWLPFGDVAYRMNLLSALCGALAITLCYQAAVTLLRSQNHARFAALCAALLLATSRIFWSQVVITEVYALNALFFAAIVLLVLQLPPHVPSVQDQNPRSFHILALTALLYGLSLGNHLTIVFSAPLLLAQCVVIWRRHAPKARQWLGILGLFLLGLSVYFYLPLRAGKQPLFNWGDPRTLRSFLWVVSGGIYRQYVLSLPLAYWMQRLLTWASLLRQQFGLVGVALGLLGLWEHAQRSAQQSAILLLTSAIYSVYAIGYNTTDSYVYLLPVYFIYALWIAQGAQHILNTLLAAQRFRSKPMATFLSFMLLVLPLNSLRTNLPVVDLSRDYTAYQYGSQVFAQVPDGSIILSGSDAHTFTLWYFAQVVVGSRHTQDERCTQIAVIDRDLLGYDWYVHGLRQTYPWLLVPVLPGHGSLTADQLIEANAQNATIFCTDADADWMSRYHWQQEGVLYRWLGFNTA